MDPGSRSRDCTAAGRGASCRRSVKRAVRWRARPAWWSPSPFPSRPSARPQRPRPAAAAPASTRPPLGGSGRFRPRRQCRYRCDHSGHRRPRHGQRKAPRRLRLVPLPAQEERAQIAGLRLHGGLDLAQRATRQRLGPGPHARRARGGRRTVMRGRRRRAQGRGRSRCRSACGSRGRARGARGNQRDEILMAPGPWPVWQAARSKVPVCKLRRGSARRGRARSSRPSGRTGRERAAKADRLSGAGHEAPMSDPILCAIRNPGCESSP